MDGGTIPKSVRRIALAAILAMAAFGAWAVGTHRLSYVVTHGISMNPVYYAGDLVVLTKPDSYSVGDIAAYHGPKSVEVLHRIIGGDAAGGYTFKGDNNQSIDISHPPASELIGRPLLHVPHGGIWLQPFLSPTALGMLGFLFVSGSVTARTRREIPRGHRKKRMTGMAGGGGSWAAAKVILKAIGRLHPALRVIAALTALFAVASIVLGLLGWMKPTTQTALSSSEAGESMIFSYSAKVTPSAAYDGTVAYSPDPIYRQLANFVSLQMQYRGQPGRIDVGARLASQSGGWHSTIQLSQTRQFTTDRYTGTVTLDLDGLQERAIEAGEAIGTDLSAINITVTPRVLHSNGTSFEPDLALALNSLQLNLAGDAASLVVNQSGSTSGGGISPRQISVLGRDLMIASEAREYAVWLLLAAVIGVIGIGLMAMRSVPLATRVQIQRRYGHLLVPVEPMTGKQDEPVVTVATFPALVKLSEKYGQMILTWTRPDGADDFVVRDDGVLYRYRIVPARPAAEKPPLAGMPHPARRSQKSAARGITSVTDSPAQSSAATPAAQTPEVPLPEHPAEPNSISAQISEPDEPSREQAGKVTASEKPDEPKPEQFTEPVALAEQHEEATATAGQPEEAGATPGKQETDASAEQVDGSEAAERREEPAETAPEEARDTEATTEQVDEADGESETFEPKSEAPPQANDVLTEAEGEPSADKADEPEAASEAAIEAEPEAEAVPETEQTDDEPLVETTTEEASSAEATPEPAEKEEPAEKLMEEPALEVPVVEESEAVSRTRVQPPRRSRKRGQKPAPAPEPRPEANLETQTQAEPESTPGNPTDESPAKDDDPTPAATVVPENGPAAKRAAGPRKRGGRRRHRNRKSDRALDPQAQAEANRKTAEDLAANRKSAAEIAAERRAAEDLVERNKALEQAITRQAERDQAAADRARKERLARTAPRDPAYDFLPRGKQQEEPLE